MWLSRGWGQIFYYFLSKQDQYLFIILHHPAFFFFFKSHCPEVCFYVYYENFRHEEVEPLPGKKHG